MHMGIIVESRITARVQILVALTLATTVFISAMAEGAQAQSANANDTARLLAGMQPAPGSSLLALTKERTWQQHANRLNALFAQVENRQLARIRSWSRAKVTTPSPVLFYMFSGPDFLYANAFFPHASTYVMSGLEPTGPVPDLTKLSRDSLAHGLRGIEESLNSILTYSFFQTIDMRRTLVASSMPGTLPILYVFLARSGKVIRDVSLVRVDEDGAVHIDDGVAGDAKSIRGVKIDFVPEETWRAVRGILDDPTRKPPRGVRTLLGGLALCPCGNVVTGMPSHTGHHIYRCTPATRNRAYHGGHVARQAEPVEEFIEKLVVARLSRPDAADLVSVEEAGVDVAGLREEAAAIRRNLEEMAGDCALGRISRAQMLKATAAGNARLEAIGAELDSAARENVLAPLVAAENAAAVWAGLDISRKRAVIKTLMSVTLHSPGKGPRRAFDPATVQVTWNQPDAA